MAGRDAREAVDAYLSLAGAFRKERERFRIFRNGRWDCPAAHELPVSAALGQPPGALAGDLGRSDKRTRALVTEIVREAIELIATRIRARNENDRAAARSHAVGAIGVARAVSDEQLSREY